MKKNLILLHFLAATFFANAQNVGIGTTIPKARLHVTDSSVLFSADGDIPGVQGILPQEGAGRRMMWFPVKAAFRAGYVNGNQWNNANIGNYSMATGFGTTASQGYSTALGFFSMASGVASTALGNQTTAKAFGSLSIGSLNDFTDNPDPLNPNPSDRIFQIGNGFGFFPGNAMTVLRNGNVGIGITNPNSPLSFPPALGKKITLYPGATGDVGFAVQGNLLQIYSDNPNADIAFGYDQGGVLNEKFRIKATGALALNGNSGNPGQILVSNGAGGPASWLDQPPKPYAFTIIPSLFSSLNGVLLSRDIDGVNNTPFTLNQNSTVVYTLTLPVSAVGPGTIDSKGYVVVEIVNSSSARVSYASSDYYIKRSTSTTQIATGVALNLPAGTYTIKARLVRLAVGDGDVDTHASFNSNQQGIQFIAQVLPN